MIDVTLDLRCPVSLCWHRIAPVQLSDSGIYTCVARSRAGLAELNFDLQVQGTSGTLFKLITINKMNKETTKSQLT